MTGQWRPSLKIHWDIFLKSVPESHLPLTLVELMLLAGLCAAQQRHPLTMCFAVSFPTRQCSFPRVSPGPCVWPYPASSAKGRSAVLASPGVSCLHRLPWSSTKYAHRNVSRLPPPLSAERILALSSWVLPLLPQLALQPLSRMLWLFWFLLLCDKACMTQCPRRPPSHYAGGFWRSGVPVGHSKDASPLPTMCGVPTGKNEWFGAGFIWRRLHGHAWAEVTQRLG